MIVMQCINSKYRLNNNMGDSLGKIHLKNAFLPAVEHRPKQDSSHY